ncbi:MAG: ATP phosphoribosyltransferase regulatory subunit [Eubacteriales bacterium]
MATSYYDRFRSPVQRTDYYTDIVFSAYVEGCGDAVLTGGRYDNLLASFDAPMPAIGFADVNVRHYGYFNQ